MPADPLESLRLPDAPIAPRPEFATDLWGRLLTALGADRAPATSTPAADQPSFEPALGVYICAHDAAAAIDFYRAAFGAVETLRMTADDGRVGHAEVTIEGVTMMLSDEYPEIGVLSPRSLGGTPVTLYLHVADVDAVYARAVAAGASSEREPADQFHGNRNATLRDPFGHRWMITQPVEAVSAEEMARRAPDFTVATTPEPAAPGDRAVPELGYFTLTAPDVDRAAAFYGALFGWRFDPATPGSSAQTYRHVGNTSLPFGFHDASGDRSPHHYYRVDDVAAMVARVWALGGEVLEVTESPSGATASCRDDQGVEFDLWQPAPGH